VMIFVGDNNLCIETQT